MKRQKIHFWGISKIFIYVAKTIFAISHPTIQTYISAMH